MIQRSCSSVHIKMIVPFAALLCAVASLASQATEPTSPELACWGRAHQQAGSRRMADRLFHKPGLIFLWALNDACSDAKIDSMIDAFAKANVAAVCLHPRPGLLKPYGGDAWFDFVKRTVDRCAEKGVDVWLYDEDPYPSGNCGGWITIEHPEYRAMSIQRFEPAAAPERDGLYCFPSGTLLWCGLVNEATGETIDLTSRVGLVRRQWGELDPWDSRYYYPATPLYHCPRAWTHTPEYAVEVIEVPNEFELLAFVAQPVGGDECDPWGAEPDRLNPDVTIGNLFPTFPYFALPGLDLIIPAVGDQEHPLINLGVLSATSAAQRLDRPGVLSESLACSGLDFTARQAGRILRWQMMMGVTTHVIHAAYNSEEGLRLTDAPPDFGPASSRWEGMVKISREMASRQTIVRDAVQIAPVAIVWPIRSFAAQPAHELGIKGLTADWPLRNELVRLVQLCLDRQVGLHLIDESDLWRARLEDRRLMLGKAKYSHVLIPSCIIMHQRTVQRLREAVEHGVTVVRAGASPRWQQTDTGLEPAQLDWRPAAGPVEAAKRLPRLIDMVPESKDVRCTAWRRDGKRTRLLMNLNPEPRSVVVDGRPLRLLPGRIHVNTQHNP
jgi:hypothetical protein